MLIRKLDLDDFQLTDDCYWQALYPWNGVVDTPFGSGWTYLVPGQKTKPHQHHEQETYFIAKGTGEMRVNGEAVEMSPGDVIYLPPFNDHVLENTSEDEDLLFLSVYWEDLAVLEDLRKRNASQERRRSGTSTHETGAEARAKDPRGPAPNRSALLQVASLPSPETQDGAPIRLAAGPFLAADACRRYLANRGVEIAAGSSPAGGACSFGLGLGAKEAPKTNSEDLERLLAQLEADGLVESRPGERVFHLGRVAETLRRAWLSMSLGPALRADCERRLANLEEETQGEIALDDALLESLAPWLAPSSAAPSSASRSFADDSAPRPERIVFLDLADAFRLGVLLPGLLMAAGRADEVPRVYVSSGGFRDRDSLEAQDLLAKAPVDVVRLFLASRRSEGSSAALDPEGLMELRHRLERRWLPWLAALSQRLQKEYGGTVPGTGLWTEEHRRFYEELQRLVGRAQEAYEPASLSLPTAARLLDDLVWTAERFAAQEEAWKSVPGRADERRTSVALELTAAKVLAMMAAPVMPTLAEDLACALGYDQAPAWEAVPAWVPGGVELMPFDLDFA